MIEGAEWWREHWRGMPAFTQRDITPTRTVEVTVKLSRKRAQERFQKHVGGKLSHGTWMWYPPRKRRHRYEQHWVGGASPRHPVYVPSKGRHETPLTIRFLQGIGLRPFVVVEAQEAEAYARVVKDPDAQILVLPHRDQGLVVTRNWIWDHARDSGAERFWTFDDNIEYLYRLHDNVKLVTRTPAAMAAIEAFAARYENLPVVGMHYEFLTPRRKLVPPFYMNTRVYSNMLLDARSPYRNEGFYNDDTDLCLRVLKDGHPTVLFNAFLVKKIATMLVKGGMTTYYTGEGERGRGGRLDMAMELQRKHPDVTTVTRKWGRWQHHVDYRSFAGNALKLREGVVLPEGDDEFGMRLEDIPT